MLCCISCLVFLLCCYSDEGPYALKDTEGEKEMKCTLAESLARARAQPLFAVSRGLKIYFTLVSHD